MNSQQFFNALNKVDDRFITEAEEYKAEHAAVSEPEQEIVSENEPENKRSVYYFIAAAVACAALCLAVNHFTNPENIGKPTIEKPETRATVSQMSETVISTSYNNTGYVITENETESSSAVSSSQTRTVNDTSVTTTVPETVHSESIRTEMPVQTNKVTHVPETTSVYVTRVTAAEQTQKFTTVNVPEISSQCTTTYEDPVVTMQCTTTFEEPVTIQCTTNFEEPVTIQCTTNFEEPVTIQCTTTFEEPVTMQCTTTTSTSAILDRPGVFEYNGRDYKYSYNTETDAEGEYIGNESYIFNNQICRMLVYSLQDVSADYALVVYNENSGKCYIYTLISGIPEDVCAHINEIAEKYAEKK